MTLDPGTLAYMIVLLAILVITAYTELKDNKIPNWVTIPGVLAGFLIAYMPGHIPLKSSLTGFVIGFVFLFVFYLYGGMGGGDVKLMGAVGALQGHPLILDTLVYTAIYGGLMAVLMLIWRKHLWRGVWRSLTMFFRNQSPDEESTEDADEKMGSIPYGLAIIGGAFTTLVLYAP